MKNPTSSQHNNLEASWSLQNKWWMCSAADREPGPGGQEVEKFSYFIPNVILKSESFTWKMEFSACSWGLNGKCNFVFLQKHNIWLSTIKQCNISFIVFLENVCIIQCTVFYALLHHLWISTRVRTVTSNINVQFKDMGFRLRYRKLRRRLTVWYIWYP